MKKHHPLRSVKRAARASLKPLKKPLNKVRVARAKRKSSPWKKLRDVREVTLSKGKNGNGVKIGRGAFGNVYIGRIKFKDGSIRRVAVKVFKDPIDNKTAYKYMQVIEDLRNAGVRIPKMGMVLVNKENLPVQEQSSKSSGKEWVLVSQLFGSSGKKSKLFRPMGLSEFNAKMEAAMEFAKVMNAGYAPYSDLIEPFKERKKGVLPFDIDLLVKNGKIPVDVRAIYFFTSFIRFVPTNAVERDALFKTALLYSNPEMKRALLETKKKHFPEFQTFKERNK